MADNTNKLVEKYRPRVWADVIGQDKALATIERLRPRGLGGRAYWVSGPTGCGKTTIARLLAAEIADGFNVEELDADTLTADRLDGIAEDMAYFGLGAKTGRAFIVNEAHGLRAPIIRRLLTILERIPGHCLWVFTTTRAGSEKLFEDQIDAHPLLSRCTELAVTSYGVKSAFAKRAQEIASAEGLDGQPLAKYERLIADCGNSMRAALQAIESGAMIG